jgi:hypothetical protein
LSFNHGHRVIWFEGQAGSYGESCKPSSNNLANPTSACLRLHRTGQRKRHTRCLSHAAISRRLNAQR